MVRDARVDRGRPSVAGPCRLKIRDAAPRRGLNDLLAGRRLVIVANEDAAGCSEPKGGKSSEAKEARHRTPSSRTSPSIPYTSRNATVTAPAVTITERLTLRS